MLARRLAAMLGILLAAPAFAGCADEAPAAEQGEPVRPGSTTGGSGSSGLTSTVPPPKPPSQRWHFHDHWKGSPTITLLNRTVELNATQNGDGVPALGVLLTLEPGIVVPPETGQIGVTVSWDPQVQGLLNLTYRPADSNGFAPAADLENGATAAIRVTESMADVPHRAQSLWAFNLTAKPGGTPPTLPAREVHVTITATIGRPLFIDPPHLDWWQGRDALPLVMEARGEMEAARTPAGNFSLPPLGGQPAQPQPGDLARPVRVAADEGRIVPEGSKTIVVLLNWTSEVPDQKLLVRYREANLPSEGDMAIAKDGVSSRVFVVPVDPDQTDTTYSNRTTWEFEIVPEGDASAFRGTYTLYAWVARVEQDVAVRATVGTV